MVRLWENTCSKKYQNGNTNKIIGPEDFGGDKYSKNISDNTNKIKSQDFGGNKYSKNIMIIYITNDRF